MIIACPSCGARFNLDAAKLLPAGRNVRCAKCDHRWRQMPEGMEEPAPEVPAPLPPAPEPIPEPEPAPAAEQAAYEPAPPAEEAEPHPPSPPETPAEMAEHLAQIAEQVAGARGEGAARTPRNPIERLGRRMGGPGPITVPPRMRPMRPARKRAPVGLIVLAGCIIGVLVAGYVFAGVIARTVPGADVIYAMLGMDIDDPSQDLEISVDDFDLSTDEKTGQKVFDLKATVFNKTEHAINMPALSVVPVDEAGGRLEPLSFRLRELVVQPGQNIKFEKSFENWPATAPNFEVKLADSQ